MADILVRILNGALKRLKDMGDGTVAEVIATEPVRLTPSLSYEPVEGSPFTLTASWQKVATVTAETKALLVSSVTGARVFDIEWTSVPEDDAAPVVTKGHPVGFDNAFAQGLPLGDLYLKSDTLQQAAVTEAVSV